jgi:tetratricopeptide (TPR) repeat protein
MHELEGVSTQVPFCGLIYLLLLNVRRNISINVRLTLEEGRRVKKRRSNMKKFVSFSSGKILSAIFILLLCISLSIAQAQTPQETLTQYISDLQKNPNDNALREKIIRFVQTMKQKPVMSSEAEKYEGRAEYAIKNAKNEADFFDAAKEYDKALLLAPWVSSYYFNQAIAYEKAGKPKEAKQSFEFYLLAAPDAQDARDVRKRIAGLEYAAEKAAKATGPETVAAQEQNKFEDWLKKLDGRRYTFKGEMSGKPGWPSLSIIDVKGEAFVTGQFDNNGRYNQDPRPPIKIQGRETTIIDQIWQQLTNLEKETLTISEDGYRITYRYWFNGGGGKYYEQIYFWKR